MRRIRSDLFICLLLAIGICFGLYKLGDSTGIILKLFDSFDNKKVVEIPTDEVGGIASDELPVVTTLAEMKKADSNFTMKMPYVSYLNFGTIDDSEYHYRVLKIEDSSTVIVARVNSDNLQKEGEYYTLPAGTLVHETPGVADLLIDRYGDRYKTITDYYIDMDGIAGTSKINSGFMAFSLIITAVIPFVAFLLFMLLIFGLHAIGVKIGIFPPIFHRTKRNKDN